MKIVIAGLPKTGTTRIFYKIRNSLEDPVREMFEPSSYEPEPADTEQSVLAKKLIAPKHVAELTSFEGFDKKIAIVRDPRDWVISMLLYDVFSLPIHENPEAIRQILDLLRRKEEIPSAVSVLELI